MSAKRRSHHSPRRIDRLNNINFVLLMISSKLSSIESINALKLEIQHEKDFNASIPVDIEVELDFGCYFYTVKYGEATLGVYSKSDDCWRGTSFYSDRAETFHESSTEARAAIISAYAKQPVIIPEVLTLTYHVTLETAEADEKGIVRGRRSVVSLDADAKIDWDLWVDRYGIELGEEYNLVKVVRSDDRKLEEF